MQEQHGSKRSVCKNVILLNLAFMLQENEARSVEKIQRLSFSPGRASTRRYGSRSRTQEMQWQTFMPPPTFPQIPLPCCMTPPSSFKAALLKLAARRSSSNPLWPANTLPWSVASQGTIYFEISQLPFLSVRPFCSSLRSFCCSSCKFNAASTVSTQPAASPAAARSSQR